MIEFTTASRIILGAGSSANLAQLVAEVGNAAFLVVSAGAAARADAAAECATRLLDAGVIVGQVAVRGEPEIAAVAAAAALARLAGADCVVAIGGGSVLDTGKAIAALVTNQGSPLDYMEAIGAGRALTYPALPIIAVPTTAGAGSEATRNAVIRSAELRGKASIRDASLLPRIALVDPALSIDLPADVTAACGMDALTQLIEPFVGRRANPITDGLCREGLRLAADAIRRVVLAPDLSARSAMSTAALLSGMALANAGLGAVHGIAAPLGGILGAPHGAICAALLAPITNTTIARLQHDDPRGPGLARYTEVAHMLGCLGGLSGLPEYLHALTTDLGIPRLKTFGLQPSDIPDIAEQAVRSSGARNNPVLLETTELAEAIHAAW